MTAENKVIYSMVGVSKFYDKKPVLKDIYLSYFYGAKIGVIGLNGSGKSSLLRILAGVDKEINGETVISPGFTVSLKALPSEYFPFTVIVFPFFTRRKTVAAPLRSLPPSGTSTLSGAR